MSRRDDQALARVVRADRRPGCGRGGSASLAVSAVDIALWDLKARRFGTPLWRLLGGHDPRVPAYAGGIDLGFSLDQLLRQTDDNLKKGFRAITMKVGRSRFSEDLEGVRATRDHFGADFPLMVDANMRWSANEAVRAARRLSEFAVYWLEEPTIPDDVEGHRRIVRDGGRESAHALRVQADDRIGRGHLPRG